mmetsp:Transcript_34267/g.51680  ORF Transcript_34267/g.51680 Transcript_34267/m.51680 type:complete len:176 (-) Transcript_34267:135-662(-)
MCCHECQRMLRRLSTAKKGREVIAPHAKTSRKLALGSLVAARKDVGPEVGIVGAACVAILQPKGVGSERRRGGLSAMLAGAGCTEACSCAAGGAGAMAGLLRPGQRHQCEPQEPFQTGPNEQGKGDDLQGMLQQPHRHSCPGKWNRVHGTQAALDDRGLGHIECNLQDRRWSGLQ